MTQIKVDIVENTEDERLGIADVIVLCFVVGEGVQPRQEPLGGTPVGTLENRLEIITRYSLKPRDQRFIRSKDSMGQVFNEAFNDDSIRVESVQTRSLTDDDDFAYIPLIIGVAVGGGVILITIITGVTLLLLHGGSRRRRWRTYRDDLE